MISYLTKQYGERIVVRRTFIEKNKIKPESLALIATLLSNCPDIDKKSIKGLVGVKFGFSAYSYSDGYILEGRLFQVENLSYIFTNPYEKAISMLNEIFNNGFKKDEESLNLCKCILASKNNKAVSYLLSSYYAFGSELKYEKGSFEKLTCEELTKDFETIKNSNTGDYFYIGGNNKTDILSKCFSYTNVIKPIEDTAFEAKNEKNNNLDDNAVMFLLSNSKIESYEDYLYLKLALKVIQNANDNKLKVNIAYRYELSNTILDRSHSAISLSFNKGTATDFLNKVNQEEFFIYKDISNSLYDFKKELLELKTSLAKAYETTKFLSALGIYEDGLIDKDFVLDEERLKQVLSSIKILGVSATEKGEN